MQASLGSKTQDERETCAFFLIVLLIERRQSTRAQQSARRPKIEQEATKNRAKIVETSILQPPGRRRSIRGRPGTPPGRRRGGQKRARGAPRALLGFPGPPRALLGRAGARQERSGTLRKRSRDAFAARWCRRTLTEAPADRFLTFSTCRMEALMCVSYHSCQCFVDVARFLLERHVATKNFEKRHQNDGKSRPGAPRERSERAKSRSNAPDRPEKRSASAR